MAAERVVRVAKTGLRSTRGVDPTGSQVSRLCPGYAEKAGTWTAQICASPASTGRAVSPGWCSGGAGPAGFPAPLVTHSKSCRPDGRGAFPGP
eukprot:2282189-Heterocapsa_arctica.AAC.1